MPRHLARSATVLAAALTAVLLMASAAGAADRVYWANILTPSISYASIDGTGAGGDVPLTGGTVGQPQGVAIDAARNRIYWANTNGTTISFANLDGTGAGGVVNTTGATVNFPRGVAIDPARGRIYWANFIAGGKISFANLDGTGGGDLDTTGATASSPVGVAIDPAHNRIYWANTSGKISFANLDGTGAGGDLNTTGATVNFPEGVAVDPAHNRIYWANPGAQKISYANLDGTGGGGDLNTTGATVNGPVGVAVDPAGNRIYWANDNVAKISAANLDGTGGGADIATTGATVNGAAFVALLHAPGPAGAPVASGGGPVGASLSCTAGQWQADLLGGLSFSAPQTLSYSWLLAGTGVPGAAAASFTPTVPGAYACRVTAANPAGSAVQDSAAVQVTAPPLPDADGDGRPDATDRCPHLAAATPSGCPAVHRPGVTARGRKRLGAGRISLAVTCNQPCVLTATGKIGAFALVKATGAGSAKRVTLTLKLSKAKLTKLRAQLTTRAFVTARLKVTATVPDGARSTSVSIRITA